LNEKLNPLSGVLKSGVLDEIPLEVFGLTPTGLLEMMAASPEKISALFDTFVKIARRFDVTIEHLLLAAMRSYVEQNRNHFEDLELAAEKFRLTHPWAQTAAPDLARLREYLTSVRGYTIDETKSALPAELANLRAITTGGNGSTPHLRLNPRLGDWQRAFLLAREIGYRELAYAESLTTSPILRVDSFEQLLNNFRASYFAGALLLDRKSLITDMRQLFSAPAWEGDALLAIKRRYQATPEMFFHRLSQIVPHQLGLEQMYFVRFDHRRGTPEVRIGKELHYQRMHGTHSIGVNEHYCRRWISHQLLTRLEKNLADDPEAIVAGAQRSRFHGSGEEYFSIALAYPHGLEPGLNSCVMLGFHVDETLKSVVRFWNDSALPVQVVGDTCERCGVVDCSVREVAPSLRDREQRRLRQFEALTKL
jgi:XRE family transcriptional regulator, fatty acid utilization regulator